MKKGLCILILLCLIVLPGLGITEGDDTIQIARTLYTLARDESYDTKLALGSVIMNRVDSPWYPDSIKEVIGEPHQFPHGTLYDEESLAAAREIMMGRRTLPEWVVGYVPLSAENSNDIYETVGNYGFFGK